jgi:hypothetical protein
MFTPSLLPIEESFLSMTDISEAARAIVAKFSQAVVRGHESIQSGQVTDWACIVHAAICHAAGQDDDELQRLAFDLYWRIQHVGGVPVGFKTRNAVDELAAALKAAASVLGLEPLPPRTEDEDYPDDAVDRPPVEFVYENWEGEIRVRKAVPVRLIYGSNQWHTEDQWMLEAVDVESGANRTFAFKGIIKFL